MSTFRRTRPLLLAALVVGAGACASTGGMERTSLLSEAPPARERACRVAASPSELPAAESLVDAGALAEEAARLWSAAGRPASAYVLLSLRYDRDGMNVRRAVLEHNVEGAVADSLQRLVFAHRRQAAPAEAEWGVRLRVDLGEAPRLRVGRREVCTAAPRDAVQLRSAQSAFDVRDQFYASFTRASPADPGLVWVRVRLDAAGYVTDARVERSLVRGMWESRLLNYVRTLTFVPASEDGQPVAGEATLPFRIPL